MIDLFVLFTPFILLAIFLRFVFVGCGEILGLDEFTEADPDDNNCPGTVPIRVRYDAAFASVTQQITVTFYFERLVDGMLQPPELTIKTWSQAEITPVNAGQDFEIDYVELNSEGEMYLDAEVILLANPNNPKQDTSESRYKNPCENPPERYELKAVAPEIVVEVVDV